MFPLAGTIGGISATMYCLKVRNVVTDSQLLNDPVKYVHLRVNMYCMYVHVCLIEGCVRELSIHYVYIQWYILGKGVFAWIQYVRLLLGFNRLLTHLYRHCGNIQNVHVHSV